MVDHARRPGGRRLTGTSGCSPVVIHPRQLQPTVIVSRSACAFQAGPVRDSPHIRLPRASYRRGRPRLFKVPSKLSVPVFARFKVRNLANKVREASFLRQSIAEHSLSAPTRTTAAPNAGLRVLEQARVCWSLRRIPEQLTALVQAERALKRSVHRSMSRFGVHSSSSNRACSPEWKSFKSRRSVSASSFNRACSPVESEERSRRSVASASSERACAASC